jgi:hypothetical protein
MTLEKEYVVEVAGYKIQVAIYHNGVAMIETDLLTADEDFPGNFDDVIWESAVAGFESLVLSLVANGFDLREAPMYAALNTALEKLTNYFS